MLNHYLPLSISNRTSATIQVHYEAPLSLSASGYADIIGPFQTTPTKAIKTDFKLQNLQSVISIDLEEPELIKIELNKNTRRASRLPRHNSSASSASTATSDGHHATSSKKKDGMHPGGRAVTTLKKKIRNTVLGHNRALNQNLVRLEVDYYLNSEPLKVRGQEVMDEELVEEEQPPDAIAGPSEHPVDRGLRGETDGITLVSPHVYGDHRSEPARKKLFIPKFEIFQSISDDGSVSIMVLKRRNFSNWMSHLPDEVPISSLTIPGTHQSCATYGWPIGQCQTRPLATQLKEGIRFLDIRLALPSKGDKSKKQKEAVKSKIDDRGRLRAYHGIQSQKIKFQEILTILDHFLTSQPTETIIVSIKRENHGDPALFKNALRDELVEFYHSEENLKRHWWLHAFLPHSLKQTRGKLILFSRMLHNDPNEEDFGIRFPVWPNNSSEIWETSIPNTNVAVQDWYGIGSCLSISKKSTLACVSLCGAVHEPLRSTSSPIPTTSLGMKGGLSGRAKGSVSSQETGREENGSRQMSPEDVPPRTWVITFLSASSLFLGFPNICARGIGLPARGLGIEGINSRVTRWLVSRRDHPHHSPQTPNNPPSGGSTAIKGVVCLIDFYQYPKHALVSLLVDSNFPS